MNNVFRISLLVLLAALAALGTGVAEADGLPSGARYGLPGMASLPGAPAIEGCEALLLPAVVDELRLRTIDPEEERESARRRRPNGIEESPATECRHLAWKALHETKAPLETLLEEPLAAAAVAPLAAAVGTNVDLANGLSSYQGEVQIAIDPSDPNRMVAGANSFYRDSACVSPTGGAGATYGTQALYGSRDGGATWVYQCAPWPSSLTGGVANAVAWFGSDPAMAWDSAGNAYAVYMLVSENSNGSSFGSSIVVAKSVNAGASWTSLGTVVDHIGNANAVDDKEMVAIDRSSGKAYSHPNRLYVIWDENNVERVAYSDGGASWSTAVVSNSGIDIGGAITVGPDGAVYAVWNHYSTSGGVNAGDSTWFSRSTNGGASWSAAAQIGPRHALASFGSNNLPPAQNQRGVNAFPSIDVDTNPASATYGRLYVVYCDFPSGTGSGNDLDVWEIWSGNGGSTWSAPVRVNDDGAGSTQFFPWASVDQSDGSLNVSFYDTRNYTSADRQTQIYYARSVNGGVSFEPNVSVTDNGSAFGNAVGYADENSADNTRYNGNQYGDYAGMAAANRRAHALWTDTRNYFPGTTTDARKEDVATSAIVNCSAPSAISPPSTTCSGASIAVSWSAPAGWGTNATGGTYEVDRFTNASCTQGKVVLATGRTGTTYTDATAAAGTTYTYQIVARNNCPGTALTPMSVATSCSAARACGSTCSSPPTFAGLSSVAASSCSMALAWSPASSSCGGGITYDVFRSTAPGFTPGAGNRIATGVAASGYTDASSLANGTTYFYVVRAVDTASGLSDSNNVQRSAAATCVVAKFYTLGPCRVLDTRKAAGPLGGPALGAGATRTFALAGSCGVPTNAVAVSANVTAVAPTAAGDLRVWAAGTPLPPTTVLSFQPGKTRANNAIVGVAKDGTAGVTFKNDASAPVDVLLDVNGFYR